MLDPRIDLCLRVIESNRPRGGRDYYYTQSYDKYCQAYNHLLTSFRYHRPATHMMHFGKSSLTGKTKLSHAKRAAWLRRYADRHSVRFHADRRNAGFLAWSQVITHEKRYPEYVGNIGARIAESFRRRRLAT